MLLDRQCGYFNSLICAYVVKHGVFLCCFLTLDLTLNISSLCLFRQKISVIHRHHQSFFCALSQLSPSWRPSHQDVDFLYCSMSWHVLTFFISNLHVRAFFGKQVYFKHCTFLSSWKLLALCTSDINLSDLLPSQESWLNGMVSLKRY